MQRKEPRNTFDRASRRLPAFLFAGLIGGLLLGVIFGNIPFGVAGGVVLAPLAWFASGFRRS